MRIEKSTLALFIIGFVTITLIAVTVFPDNMLEVFSGSILALFLFQENEQFKLTKKRGEKP